MISTTASRATAIRTVAGAILVVTIVGCGLSLTIALLAVRLAADGYSAHAIGLNTAAGGIASFLAAPAIPWLARKLGVARLLMLALVAGGVALLGFAFLENYIAWLVLRFALGGVVTVNFVLSEFWITTWAPDGRRGLAIGVYATSLALGFAIGPLILIWSGTGGNLPFYLGASLFLGAAIPLALNAGDAPPLEQRSTKSLFAVLREAPAATLAALLQGGIEVAGLSLLPVYALRAGLDPGTGAFFASLFVLGNTALQLPLGALADRFDRRRLLASLAATGCVGAIVLAIVGVSPLRLFEGMLLLWGGLVSGLYPVGLSELAARYRGSELASANSTFVMFYALGMLAGPPLVGIGLDLGPAGFFWTIAVLLAAYLAITLSPVGQARHRP